MSEGVPGLEEIARLLGDDWTMTENVKSWTSYGELSGPRGARLFFRHGGWKNDGRIRITGRLDYDHKPYDAPTFQISVSDGKTPERIARDITRRILDSGYWEVLAVTMERKRAAEEAERRREELSSTLLEVLNGQTFSHSNRIRIGDGSDSEIWGDVDVWSDDVKFEIHVPAAQAQQFASMVAALRRGDKEA
jgi:hypothetical protein